MDGQETPFSSSDTESLALEDLAAPARRAVRWTRQWLLAQQQAEGFWCAEVEGSAALESETILLLAFLGREKSELAGQLAERLVETQLAEGGWAAFPGGPPDISTSVTAYFALKLTGHAPCSQSMEQARRAILAHGGADAANGLARFYLALFGQIPHEVCPAVPPELMLMPKGLPAHLGALSAEARAIVVPLSVVSARRPVHEVQPEFGVRELFLKAPADWPPGDPGPAGFPGSQRGSRFFRAFQAGLKWCQRQHILPLRGRAIQAARAWMLQKFEESDGRGAVHRAVVWNVVALKALGYPDESPEIQHNLDQLQALVVRDDPQRSARVQPHGASVSDTALALRALAAAGIASHDDAFRQAAAWLLDAQRTEPDGRPETPDFEPAGWGFERARSLPANSDDTALALMALQASLVEEPIAQDVVPPEFRLVSDCSDDEQPWVATLRRTAPAIERGLKWLWAMQNDDGGWGISSRNGDRSFLRHVLPAGDGATGDPSTPDLTGRALEALGQLGYRTGDAAVDRAVAFLRAAQQADGSWRGHRGVNHVYGTWQALAGLAAVGVPGDDPAMAAGANWLVAHQQSSGAWGESPESYARPELRGQGTPTASQTSWALLGLMASGRGDHPAVARGVRWLLAHQQPDGTWHQPEFTGTAIAQDSYVRHPFHPISFPLLAIARWMRQSFHPASPMQRER